MRASDEAKFWMAYDKFKAGDYFIARKMFEEIQNDVDDAKHQLAYLYQMGLGGEKLTDRSIDLYKTLAYKGNVDAAYDLAGFYLRANKTLESIEFFEISAKAGNCSANYWLSEIYAGHGGFETNIAVSMEYLELATQQGHLLAKRYILKEKIKRSKSFFEKANYKISLLFLRVEIFKILWKDNTNRTVS